MDERPVGRRRGYCFRAWLHVGTDKAQEDTPFSAFLELVLKSRGTWQTATRTSQVPGFGPTTDGPPPTPAPVTARWTTAAAPALTPSGLTACSIQSGPRARPCPSSAQKCPWLPCPWGKSQSPSSPMDPPSVLTPYSPRPQPHGPPRGSSITCASGPLHPLRPLPGPLSPGSTQPTPSLPVCLKSQQHPPDSSLCCSCVPLPSSSLTR